MTRSAAKPQPTRPPTNVTQRAPRRRARRRLGLLFGLVALVAAVGLVAGLRRDGDTESSAPTTAPPVAAAKTPTLEEARAMAAAAFSLVPDAVGAPLSVLPGGGLHVVGRERFAVGLIDGERGPVEVDAIDLLFLKVAGNEGALTETLRAPFLPYGLREAHTDDHPPGEITGIYAAIPRFDTPGQWGVVARVTMPDGTLRTGQSTFAVQADSPVPGPGDKAIASRTLTAATPEEARKVCTGEPPDAMHALSIDQALANGKPTVVLFATPLLCSSRTCGPSLEALVELQRRYGTGANFIHVEVFPERDGTKPAPAMAEWSLPSEPWLFLISPGGTVVERFEGGIGLTELDPAVQRLVGQAGTRPSLAIVA